MRKIVLLLLLKIVCFSAFSQARIYFDDGLPYDRGFTNKEVFKVTFEDTTTASLWQIGTPQKSVFNSAASLPYALLTDTMQPFPADTVSSFYLTFLKRSIGGNSEVIALRWLQKLDMEKGEDYGKVALSLDGGQTFDEVFRHRAVYNFFGYYYEHIDTLADSSLAFSGTDTLWRDIWFCLYADEIPDTVLLKFTFSSGSNLNGRDGWMIDNFRAEPTWSHTVREMEGRQQLSVFPNPSHTAMTVALKQNSSHRTIRQIQLINAFGQGVHAWDCNGASRTIDVSGFAAGYYKLRVTTDVKDLIFPVIIQP